MLFDLPYGVVLAAHLTAMFSTITVVVVADTLGLLWFFGKLQTLSKPLLTWLHRLVMVGLFISIITGAWMFSTVSSFLLTQPALYVKVGLVVALIINAYFIHHHMDLATKQASADLSLVTKRSLLIFGSISTISWIGILIASQFLGL